MKSGQNVILIGMPGVGKSTLGVLLAKALGYSFMDTDVTIQAAQGRLLREIIAEAGIDAFCRIEESYLLSISCRCHVIAPGGSAVYSEKAMEHLKGDGLVIHLDLDPEILKDRLGDIDARGVVHRPGQSLEALFRERHPLYRKYADLTIVCDGLSPQEIVDRIIAAIIEPTGQGPYSMRGSR